MNYNIIELKNKKIYEIDSNFRDVDSIPRSLCCPDFLKNLSIINISGNKITTLPNLPTNTIYLDITSNKLKKLPNIPKTLKQLKCGFNDIKKFPNIPKDSEINYIDLSNNQLTEINGINLTMLIYFDASFNKLTDSSESHIYNLSNLETLKLVRNNFTNIKLLPKTIKLFDCTANEILKLPENIEFCENLTDIFASKNKLTFINILSKNLEKLYISNNRITHFPHILPKTLQILDISFNLLTNSTLPNIFSKNLKELYCIGNPIVTSKLQLQLRNCNCNCKIINILTLWDTVRINSSNQKYKGYTGTIVNICNFGRSNTYTVAIDAIINLNVMCKEYELIKI